jgi:lipid II:glycine glycyltransferase (peptidoglycan interpeptide bridge formation enzyme)
MLTIEKKILMFDIKEVHFSNDPFDVEDCDFLVFPFCKNKVDANGFTRYEKLTSVIDLHQDLETIQKNFHRDTRKGIRRAENAGVKILKNEGYEQFYEMNKKFIKKKGLSSIFEHIGAEIASLETMKKKGTLFVAEYTDEIIGGLYFLEDNFNIKSLIGASKRLEQDKERRKIIGYANRLIRWEAIKYAKDKGITEFDLGGIFPGNKIEDDPVKRGINKFKLSFGGDILPGYSYEKGYSKILKFAYYFNNIKKGKSPI